MTSHPTRAELWSYERYARMPEEGRRFEVWDGRLVAMTPAPRPRHPCDPLLPGLMIPLAEVFGS